MKVGCMDCVCGWSCGGLVLVGSWFEDEEVSEVFNCVRGGVFFFICDSFFDFFFCVFELNFFWGFF